MKTQINYSSIVLDKNSPELLHLQLQKALLKELRAFPSGQPLTLMSERELSALLNISRPTVHRAYEELFNSDLVVRNADKSLSVRANARSKIVGSYRVIGILLPMDFSAYVDNNYGNGMPYLKGLISRASQLNISCMMLQVPGAYASDKEIDLFIEEHIHRLYALIHLGALHQSIGDGSGKVLRRIMARKEIPQICVSGFSKYPHVGSVVPDITAIMKHICLELKRKKVKSLGLISRTDSTVLPFDYYANYRESTMKYAALNAGIEVRGTAAHNDQENIVKLLENRPDAIFCHNNRIACDVMSTARRMGIRIPEDIIFIGYDRKTPDERITRIDPMAEEVAARAIDLAVEHFESGVTAQNRIFRLPVQLITRSSW